jgi:hypothetical protein
MTRSRRRARGSSPAPRRRSRLSCTRRGSSKSRLFSALCVLVLCRYLQVTASAISSSKLRLGILTEPQGESSLRGFFPFFRSPLINLNLNLFIYLFIMIYLFIYLFQVMIYLLVVTVFIFKLQAGSRCVL